MGYDQLIETFPRSPGDRDIDSIHAAIECLEGEQLLCVYDTVRFLGALVVTVLAANSGSNDPCVFIIIGGDDGELDTTINTRITWVTFTLVAETLPLFFFGVAVFRAQERFTGCPTPPWKADTMPIFADTVVVAFEIGLRVDAATPRVARRTSPSINANAFPVAVAAPLLAAVIWTELDLATISRKPMLTDTSGLVSTTLCTVRGEGQSTALLVLGTQASIEARLTARFFRAGDASPASVAVTFSLEVALALGGALHTH